MRFLEYYTERKPPFLIFVFIIAFWRGYIDGLSVSVVSGAIIVCFAVWPISSYLAEKLLAAITRKDGD